MFVSPPPNEWKTRNPWRPEQSSSIFLSLFMVTYQYQTGDLTEQSLPQSLPRSAPYLKESIKMYILILTNNDLPMV